MSAQEAHLRVVTALYEERDRLRREKVELVAALADCAEALRRLPNIEGAYRVSCLQQAEAALAKVKP